MNLSPFIVLFAFATSIAIAADLKDSADTSVSSTDSLVKAKVFGLRKRAVPLAEAELLDSNKSKAKPPVSFRKRAVAALKSKRAKRIAGTVAGAAAAALAAKKFSKSSSNDLRKNVGDMITRMKLSKSSPNDLRNYVRDMITRMKLSKSSPNDLLNNVRDMITRMNPTKVQPSAKRYQPFSDRRQHVREIIKQTPEVHPKPRRAPLTQLDTLALLNNTPKKTRPQKQIDLKPQAEKTLFPFYRFENVPVLNNTPKETRPKQQ